MVCRDYGIITSAAQRQIYKDDFLKEYEEYLKLYELMSSRMQIFKDLKDELAKEDGVGYEVSRGGGLNAWGGGCIHHLRLRWLVAF